MHLFWLAGALEVHLGEHSAKSPGAWLWFGKMLVARLLEGHYQPGIASFDTELSNVQIHELTQQNVPEIFFSSVIGIDLGGRDGRAPT